MSDPNMDDFYSRVARIERAHALGNGFEAEGTVGRSGALRSGIRKRPLLRSALVVVVVLVVLKAGILAYLGEATYQERVVASRQGDALDRASAFVMQADPVSLWLSVKFARIVP